MQQYKDLVQPIRPFPILVQIIMRDELVSVVPEFRIALMILDGSLSKLIVLMLWAVSVILQYREFGRKSRACAKVAN